LYESDKASKKRREERRKMDLVPRTF